MNAIDFSLQNASWAETDKDTLKINVAGDTSNTGHAGASLGNDDGDGWTTTLGMLTSLKALKNPDGSTTITAKCKTTFKTVKGMLLGSGVPALGTFVFVKAGLGGTDTESVSFVDLSGKELASVTARPVTRGEIIVTFDAPVAPVEAVAA